MQKYHSLIFLLISLFFCQCNKEASTTDCILSQEATFAALNSCRDNILPEASEIAANLVGDWKLVGYGCGFCVPHDPPEATLTLTETRGLLAYRDDFDGDTLLAFDWRLEQITNTLEEKATYRFKTEPNHYALNMDIFCNEFMFFDERPFDGQLMLYQKQ